MERFAIGAVRNGWKETQRCLQARARAQFDRLDATGRAVCPSRNTAYRTGPGAVLTSEISQARAEMAVRRRSTTVMLNWRAPATRAPSSLCSLIRSCDRRSDWQRCRRRRRLSSEESTVPQRRRRLAGLRNPTRAAAELDRGVAIIRSTLRQCRTSKTSELGAPVLRRSRNR